MKFATPFLISTRLLGVLCYSLIGLFCLLIIAEWSIWAFSDYNDQSLTIKNPLPQEINKKNTREDLLNASLFGVYVPEDLSEKSIKKSMLNVRLVGILLADKKEESQVIIRGASGIEKNYKIGDVIPGGALIKRITKEGLLVERDGIIESISLPKNELLFEPISKPLKEEGP